MYRLIWVFAGHTGLIVSFVLRWFSWNKLLNCFKQGYQNRNLFRLYRRFPKLIYKTNVGWLKTILLSLSEPEYIVFYADYGAILNDCHWS